jgi:hypothetical protein
MKTYCESEGIASHNIRPGNWMEVSGQLKTSAAFPPGKELMVPIV